MDDETVQHLWALKRVNEALIEGLKLAIFVLEREEELTPERQKSMIESLETLVSQSEEIYGKEETRH